MSDPDMMDDHERRLQRLEDIHNVERVIQQYIRSYDSRDETGLRSVFSNDIILDVTGYGRSEGIEEVLGVYHGIWDEANLQNHHITNQVIEVEGDEAIATSYWTIWKEEDRQPYHGGGFYERHLVREDGDWVHSLLNIFTQFLYPTCAPSLRENRGEAMRNPAPQDNPHYPGSLFPRQE